MALIIIWMVLFLIVLPISATIGLVVNAVLIQAVKARRNLTTTDILFVCLAVSDLIYNLFGLLGSIPRYIQYFDAAKGHDAIVILMPVYFQCIYGIPNSIGKLITALLSAERTVAVFWPSFFRTQWKKRHALLTVILGPIIVIVTAVPLSLRLKAAKKGATTNSTFVGSLETEYTDLYSNNLDMFRMYNTSYQTIFGILPIVVVLVLNIATVFGLFRVERKIGHLRRPQPNSSKTNRPPCQFITSITTTSNLTFGTTSASMKDRNGISIDNSVATTVDYLRRPTDCVERSDLGVIEEGNLLIRSSLNSSLSRNSQISQFGRDASNSISDNERNTTSSNNSSNSCEPNTSSQNITDEGKRDINSRYTFNQFRHFKQLLTRSKTRNTVLGWSKEQKRRSFTLVMVSSVFLLFNLPSKILFAVVQNSSNASYKEKTSLELDVCIGVVLFFETLNTVFNSMIFIIRSDRYSEYVYQKLRCCSRRRGTVVV